MQKKLISCPICKSKAVTTYKKTGKFSYLLCSTCQSLILNPIPTLKDLHYFYKKNFDYSNGKIEEKTIRQRSESILETFKELNPKGKEILDIGSGFGFFLDEARKKGYKTSGIEPSSKLYHFSKDELKLNVQNITLETFLTIDNKKYDFISLIHVIEHVKNPSQLITSLYKKIKKGGVLFLETPNLDSHLFYSEKQNYSYMSAPEHLWVFSKKSITKYLLNTLNHVPYIVETYSTSENFMGVIKNIFKRKKMTEQIKSYKKDHFAHQDLSYIAMVKIALFDNFLAKIFTPLLNISDKGSIIRIYIKK